MTAFDPVALAVIRGRLEQIVDEMDASLFRAAFSPVIAEARDGSHGIYETETGAMVAMGKTGLPVFIGAMSFATKAVIDRAEEDGGFLPGDAWLLNDPYVGATHLNDIKIIKPIFRNGRVFCHLASAGHWLDVGGNVPGNYNPRATDIMQEGVRIPPVKLFDQGELRQDVVDILLANTRMPNFSYGDLNAQLGALELGETRLHELLDDFGDDVIAQAMAEINSRAATQMRELISEIPDGTYAFEDNLDNDGITDAPLRIALELTVTGDRLILDFTGSAPCCAGPMNVTHATTVAVCFVALKHVFPEVPANAGCLSPIEFIIPDNSILSAPAPKPVSGYTENIMRTIDVIFGAMAQCAPDRVNGAAFSTINALMFSGRGNANQRFIMFTFFGGGLGGNPEGDGLSHGNAPIGMATIPPAEIQEAAYPIRINHWGLRPDSGGPGQFRGGLGCIYEFELTGEEADVVTFGERAIYPAFGVLGGGYGAPNRIVYDQADGKHSPALGAKLSGVRLVRGQSVRIESPGGGGYGPPADRAVEDIERDLRQGMISADGAERDYGVSVGVNGKVQRMKQ